MKKILLIDDEMEMLISLEKILKQRANYEIHKESDPTKALEILKNTKYDLIITDLKMKPVDGMEILRRSQKSFPETSVIMISGYGTIEAGVKSTRLGAADFIEKPFTSKRLFKSIDHIFSKNTQEVQSENSDSPIKEKFGLYYCSSKMDKIIKLIEKVANGNMNILITGESGTGKELIARAIHNQSNRRLNPFVPVNCGALPEPLFESELFGHEKGAFTGAAKRKPGLFEFAEGGTFLLDEIGEMSFVLQTKLLRMLEEKKIRRVGGQNEFSVDVRIIAATNQNLENLIVEKKFRQDLFYRLNTIHIEIPPLRERKEDILLLARHFLKLLCKNSESVLRQFSLKVEELLVTHDWPGNARELQNIISRAFYLSNSKIIELEDVPLSKNKLNNYLHNSIVNLSYKEAKHKILEKFEVEYLTHHLRLNKGNISKTAEACGIDRRTIHRLINESNIIYED
ncbi:MAG: sigma-54 dependent transcriptional regulator [Melioribacteraceae bacterium]|nr:sigma-54 dependent transcriptional regulator [Melioribacteraceae bacterium]